MKYFDALSKTTISRILTVVFIVLFSNYLYNNTADFKPLLSISPVLLAYIFLSHVAIILINGILYIRIGKPFDKHINILDGIHISVLTSLGNFFLPMQSGTGIRAVFLKKKYDFKYSDFSTTFINNYIIFFLATSLLGVISLIQLRENLGYTDVVFIGGPLLLIAMLCLLLVWRRDFVIFLTRLLKLLPSARFRGVAQNLEDSWQLLHSDTNLTRDLLLFSVVFIAVNVLIIYLELLCLGIDATVWQLLLYVSLCSLILFINITPAAIGIREFILIFASTSLGLTTSEILLVAIIDRSIKFAVLAVSWFAVHTIKYE